MAGTGTGGGHTPGSPNPSYALVGAEATAAHSVPASRLAPGEETSSVRAGGFVRDGGSPLALRARLGHWAGGAATGPGLCGALLGPGAGFDLASGLPSHPSQQVLASLPTAKCVRGQRFESRLCFSLAARCPSSRVASLDPGFLICKIRGLNEPVSHAFRCGIHT